MKNILYKLLAIAIFLFINTSHSTETDTKECQKRIKALYPDHICNFLSHAIVTERHSVLVKITSPADITRETIMIFTKRAGQDDYESKVIIEALADTFAYDEFATYLDPAGLFYCKKLDITASNPLTDFLPPHETIKFWNTISSDRSGQLYAEYHVPNTLTTQYWTLREGAWRRFHESSTPAENIAKVNGYLCRISHQDTGSTTELTIETIDSGTFFPTNVLQLPVKLIDDYRRGRIIFSKKDPNLILALKDYAEGCYKWQFPGSGSHNEKLKFQYFLLMRKLRETLHEQKKIYANRRLSIEYLKLYDSDDLDQVAFTFPENKSLFGSFSLQGGLEWDCDTGDENNFHPSLQLKRTEFNVPYYYVPSSTTANGKTIVLMEGGPSTQYDGSFSKLIYSMTQAGWGVIIPQESLRTGYGWQHYARGFGELGRKNLHQLLQIFYDAKRNGLIPNLQAMYLYGSSYGGFVATSFALRWEELHEEARVEVAFNFKSIIADAAMVDMSLLNQARFLPHAFLGGTNPGSFLEKYMPIHHINKLSAPLTLIHGETDVRCPAGLAREFSAKLTKAILPHTQYWHKGGHSLRHPKYEEFLMKLVEGRPIDAELTSEIGLREG